MKTTDTLSLTHERVDDIPLLLGFMQQLNFPDLLERHLGSHHLHRGLSNGWLATVWLAFLLSQSNHRKVSVQDWARNHPHTLETLIGQALRPIEFADDRLSIVLRRLHDADWSALEADLWQATCEVYEISYQCVRLDSTTSFGYHTITPDGLMQRGHSKDHRPDLPQLKLMAAAAQPTSHLLACDIVPGQSADDPLYLPLIRRVREQLRQHGLLYTGDSKMSALATRAELVAEKDSRRSAAEVRTATASSDKARIGTSSPRIVRQTIVEGQTFMKVPFPPLPQRPSNDRGHFNLTNAP